MYQNVHDVIFTMFGSIIDFICTPPVVYLFYTLIVLWIFHLFFKIAEVAR